MGKNPFGEGVTGPQRTNPFGDSEESMSVAEAATRIQQAALAIRNLKRQLGAEGLTLPATKEFIDEISAAFDAAAKALRQIKG